MDTPTASHLADEARERLASQLHGLVRESEHLMKVVQRSGNQQVDALRRAWRPPSVRWSAC